MTLKASVIPGGSPLGGAAWDLQETFLEPTDLVIDDDFFEKGGGIATEFSFRETTESRR
jgi:hypothetical protein